jgi:rRNA maturation protein Nop10
MQEYVFEHELLASILLPAGQEQGCSSLCGAATVQYCPARFGGKDHYHSFFERIEKVCALYSPPNKQNTEENRLQSNNARD